MGRFQTLSLLFRTARYLKAIQIVNRIKRSFISAKIDNSSAPSVRFNKDYNYYFIKRSCSYLDENVFLFLNNKETLAFPLGWNDPALSKLWLYNLHYFEGLLNSDTSKELKNSLIHQWIDENPPAEGNGWEPYPNSLRIVNWIKWALSGNKLSTMALHSLVIQVRVLTQSLEYHILGNHLFANAKALVFAGIFFEGEEADNWFSQGTKILEKQISEQFLNDGAHFELSTTYHALLTEDLLDIIQLMKAIDLNVPPEWLETAKKTINWLVAMTRPDGLSPLFNDAAYGITPTLEDVLSLYKAVGLGNPTKLNQGITDLTESGYFRYEAECYSFFGDAGQIGPDYIPGHAHCDMLNFELFAHGEPIIVDTGTSTYEICERRNIERGTESHNTVQFDDVEQSEIWSAFRIARRARIQQRDISTTSVCASYMGYNSSKTCHKREYVFENNLITIEDEVFLPSKATARFHFHPDISVIIENTIVNAGPIKIEYSGEDEIKLVNYEYAPEFNKRTPSKAIEVTFSNRLRTKITI